LTLHVLEIAATKVVPVLIAMISRDPAQLVSA